MAHFRGERRFGERVNRAHGDTAFTPGTSLVINLKVGVFQKNRIGWTDRNTCATVVTQIAIYVHKKSVLWALF